MDAWLFLISFPFICCPNSTTFLIVLILVCFAGDGTGGGTSHLWQCTVIYKHPDWKYRFSKNAKEKESFMHVLLRYHTGCSQQWKTRPQFDSSSKKEILEEENPMLADRLL